MLELNSCSLCPKNCQVPRNQSPGFCQAPFEPILSKVMIHPWEEPFLTGEVGTGALFFSGCNLRCLFCQNHDISHKLKGRKNIREQELLNHAWRLKEAGVKTLSLITANHFLPAMVSFLKTLKKQGFDLPIIWNSSAYEKVESLRQLEGLIDIYLPDYKFFDKQLAKSFAGAKDYPEVARDAIAEMVRQTGPLVFEGDLLKKGTVVRHLVLPGHSNDSESILADLFNSHGNDIFYTLMNQYVPMASCPDHPELCRHVTPKEYEQVVDFALTLGIEQALTQEASSQTSDFKPNFDEFSDF